MNKLSLIILCLFSLGIQYYAFSQTAKTVTISKTTVSYDEYFIPHIAVIFKNNTNKTVTTIDLIVYYELKIKYSEYDYLRPNNFIKKSIQIKIPPSSTNSISITVPKPDTIDAKNVESLGIERVRFQDGSIEMY